MCETRSSRVWGGKRKRDKGRTAGKQAAGKALARARIKLGTDNNLGNKEKLVARQALLGHAGHGVDRIDHIVAAARGGGRRRGRRKGS